MILKTYYDNDIGNLETGNTEMKVTAYNTFGTKDTRVVASFDVDTDSITVALTFGQYRSNLWNTDETRDDMRVNFVVAAGHIRRV